MRERALQRRLAEAGPGAGCERSHTVDRIALAAWVPLVVAIVLVFFRVTWHRFIVRDATVIPALLWLGTPALWAVAIAWPYRQRSRLCAAATWLGLLLAATPWLQVALALRAGR